MAINKSNISFMKDYLKFALEFEKYVYIWSHTMDEINKRMSQIYSERKQLETMIESSKSSLSSLGNTNNYNKMRTDKEIERYKRRLKISSTIVIFTLISFFIIGCVISIMVLKDESNQNIEIPLIILIGLIVMVCGSLFTGIVPVCLFIAITSKNKASELTQKSNKLNSQNSRRRQEIILSSNEHNAKYALEKNILEESLIISQQDEVHQALKNAKRNLEQLYSENVLPVKYRNMSAIATMYEYLETRRCNTIDGHGGIYDTYETERLRIESLRQQIITNQKLSNMEDTQRYIYHEMKQANQTLCGISSNLAKIEKTNSEIARNTAISAVANQQTAAATQWLAWNTWVKGY